jgi:hypothetical protein
VARVVELGFDTRLLARVRMRVRWAGSGGHGALPAWAARPAPDASVETLWVLLTVNFHGEPATGAGNPEFARGSMPV